MRIGVVGYGKITNKHLETMRALGAEIVACTNRSETMRAKAHVEGGIPTTYKSIVEMIENASLDGVLCTASVEGITQAALELIPFGLPILLEKPPGTSLEAFEEIRTLAKRHGTNIQVGTNRRHYSVFRKAVEHAGGFGNIRSALVEWSEDPNALLARGIPSSVVERWIFANSLHGLDLLAWLVGRIPQPHVDLTSNGAPFRVTMALQGLSERQAIGSFFSTWDSPGKWRVSFSTPGRRYTFAPLESCTVLFHDGKQEIIEPDDVDVRYKPGFFVQARDFLAVVRGAAPSVTLDDVAPSMALAEALTLPLLHLTPEHGAVAQKAHGL